MTLDISNLSQEKRAFLKAQPELLKSLESGANNQARKIQEKREKLDKTHSASQKKMRELEEKAEKLRLQYQVNPALRDIQRKFEQLHPVVTGTVVLICPECGETWERKTVNKKNGKPWCFKCHGPIIRKKKLKKWRKLPNVRVSKALKNEFKSRSLDF